MATQPNPDAMRAAMADYVQAVHRAYREAAAPLSPGERARLPLLAAGSFTVAAVGTRYLHIVATTDALPAPAGPEVALEGAEGDLHWTLRFFDPVVLPDLGFVDESQAAQPAAVRDLLGLSRVVYHLSVPPGGGLTPHHAQHSGTGLAHHHAAAARDYDTIASLAPQALPLVREMRAAEAAQLDASVLLLARAVAPGDAELASLIPGDAPAADSRRRLVQVLRGRT